MMTATISNAKDCCESILRLIHRVDDFFEKDDMIPVPMFDFYLMEMLLLLDGKTPITSAIKVYREMINLQLFIKRRTFQFSPCDSDVDKKEKTEIFELIYQIWSKLCCLMNLLWVQYDWDSYKKRI